MSFTDDLVIFTNDFVPSLDGMVEVLNKFESESWLAMNMSNPALILLG